jgi:hypothetical protein
MQFLIALVAVPILFIGSMGFAMEGYAAMQQAEAALIRAEAEAVLMEAQAAAITKQANAQLALYGAGSLALLCFGVAAVTLAVKHRPQPQQQPQQQQLIYVLPSGGPRRELWQALTDNRRDQLQLPIQVEKQKKFIRG